MAFLINRGYYLSTEGNHVFYVRGIDRVQRGVISTLGSMHPSWESPFEPADDLWNQMKQNLLNFVNNNGGISQSNTNQIHRPNWEEVKENLLGN